MHFMFEKKYPNMNEDYKKKLNYTFSPHFRNKIWIWSLNYFLSQSGPHFGKFDPIKSFPLVVE